MHLHDEGPVVRARDLTGLAAHAHRTQRDRRDARHEIERSKRINPMRAVGLVLLMATVVLSASDAATAQEEPTAPPATAPVSGQAPSTTISPTETTQTRRHVGVQTGDTDFRTTRAHRRCAEPGGTEKASEPVSASLNQDAGTA